MNKSLVSRYSRFISPEEQQIYDHLLEQVEIETPSELIERIRLLFIEGSGYPDRQISYALEKILNHKEVEEDFNFILNRCCYILINRWHTLSNRKAAINDLLQLFDKLAEGTLSRYTISRRMRALRELTQKFAQSEQYSALKRFAEVLSQSPSYSSRRLSDQPLRTLIPRYPYLYTHCLLSDYSSHDHQQMIRNIKAQKQRKFELDLSQYSAHQLRRLEVAKISLEAARKIQSPIQNPTLLTNRELFTALRQYVGKAEGSYTYRDVAKRFITNSKSTPTFHDFKDDFYEYLNPSEFGSSYSKRQFSDKLYKQLQSIIPHSNGENFDEFLLLRTCSQLLNFLVIESPQKPNHFIFIDLIANVGPTFAVGLLLKIVLVCRKVKPYLEKRFSILFNHYESSSQDGVQWLVKVLENLNIALTTNFGQVDLSFIR
ncbi:MAG: hypothetical protein SWJ54_22880 [Cyanobacteriota bacterium]|nr:hypothetical protein [Cyanobacteriota bacterium]